MTKFKNAKNDTFMEIGTTTLFYQDASTLSQAVTLEKEVENIIFSLRGTPTNPRDQIDRYYAQLNWNNDPKTVCFIAKGSGFVSGHAMPLDFLVKYKN
ncbi:hypothetical protein [uncultured Thomasclavelia sp.]|uniref:hypothetical protein n=1 Tax=uncultured Thomasclavelia sp. TaxID=3025759 RepID=UPI002621125B|nr:hypothetical protein [uncultured Thomasclavelia sp.]